MAFRKILSIRRAGMIDGSDEDLDLQGQGADALEVDSETSVSTSRKPRDIPGLIGSLPIGRFGPPPLSASTAIQPVKPSVSQPTNRQGTFPRELTKQLEEVRSAGRYLVVICEAEPPERAGPDGTIPIRVNAYRAAGFHPDLLLRAWKTLGADILKFALPTPESDQPEGTLSGY